jgi:hypothetical protein
MKNTISEVSFLFLMRFLIFYFFSVCSQDVSVVDSLHREYYQDGRLKMEVFYKNGKKHGVETWWHDHAKGCPMMEKYYDQGMLEGPVIHYGKNCKKTLIENYRHGIKEGWEFEYYDNGNIKAEGYYKKGYLEGMYRVYDKNGKFLYESRGFVSDEALIDDPTPDTSEFSIYHILKRNRSRLQRVIVMDLTGSMYPYARQVRSWLQLNLRADTARHYFVFFNDGDNKKDEAKRIGMTGGIYVCYAKNEEELIKVMKTVVKNGNGGDYPENVIEALLLAQKRFPYAQDLILIADNWAKVRDISLLPRVKKPVRVILCGVTSGMEINPDYLNIAYKTKGSVHTIEEDLYDLNKCIKERYMHINGFTYKIQNGTIRAE